MKVHPPTLTYHLWSPEIASTDPSGLVGDGPSLFNVHEIHASRYRDGVVRVSVVGSMRKKDGTQGRHRRFLVLDLSQPQPDWVAPYVQDARTRLGR